MISLFPSLRIWLFDVRDRVASSAQLVGFDISFDAAPHPGTLPSNVTFQHWNIKEDLPEDLISAFDIVHVRFLSFVILNEEVRGLIEKLFKMLSALLYIYQPSLSHVSNLIEIRTRRVLAMG